MTVNFDTPLKADAMVKLLQFPFVYINEVLVVNERAVFLGKTGNLSNMSVD